MKVDTSKSRYSESDTARSEFSRQELRNCRMLLRRLQFLESKVEEGGGLGAATGAGGAAFAEWEMVALEWVLTDNGYLTVREVEKGQTT